MNHKTHSSLILRSFQRHTNQGTLETIFPIGSSEHFVVIYIELWVINVVPIRKGTRHQDAERYGEFMNQAYLVLICISVRCLDPGLRSLGRSRQCVHPQRSLSEELVSMSSKSLDNTSSSHSITGSSSVWTACATVRWGSESLIHEIDCLV